MSEPSYEERAKRAFEQGLEWAKRRNQTHLYCAAVMSVVGCVFSGTLPDLTEKLWEHSEQELKRLELIKKQAEASKN